MRNPTLAARDAHKRRLMTAVAHLNLPRESDTAFLQSAVESICQSLSDVVFSKAHLSPQTLELTGHVQQAQDCVESLQTILCTDLPQSLRIEQNIDFFESIRLEVSLIVETAKEAAHDAQTMIDGRAAEWNHAKKTQAQVLGTLL